MFQQHTSTICSLALTRSNIPVTCHCVVCALLHQSTCMCGMHTMQTLCTACMSLLDTSKRSFCVCCEQCIDTTHYNRRAMSCMLVKTGVWQVHAMLKLSLMQPSSLISQLSSRYASTLLLLLLLLLLDCCPTTAVASTATVSVRTQWMCYEMLWNVMFEVLL
jgi:hypothetical protein